MTVLCVHFLLSTHLQTVPPGHAEFTSEQSKLIDVVIYLTQKDAENEGVFTAEKEQVHTVPSCNYWLTINTFSVLRHKNELLCRCSARLERA